MGLFNKAREALGQAAAAVSRETEVLSLQSQLGNTDTELSRVLVEVGKRTRELFRAGQIKDQELEVLMRRVEELETQMMDLRAKVQEAQNPTAPAAAPVATAPAAGETPCPRCSKPVTAGTRFCGECGAKME